MNDHSRQTFPLALPISPELNSAAIAAALQSALLNIHRANVKEAICPPSAEGAFPDAFFVPPLPVVPDANILRNDVLYACRNNQRTVLVNAANARLLRLFCAQHVVDEVAEHTEDWTNGSGVSARAFRRRWTNEYLPLIRVVQAQDISNALLSPEEADRIAELVKLDSDDVPTAILALVLEAFYLSNDSRALRAVYGADADFTLHAEWVGTLKAGGDAGELGRMLNLLTSVVFLLGGGLTVGVRCLVNAIGPWSLVPLALALAATKYVSSGARQRIKAASISIGTVLAHAFAAYHEISARFREAAPTVPTWEHLAITNASDAVIQRACLHTIARSGMGDRSARELALELPFLGVAQGEAKVRSTLRSHALFFEVWRGRWQLGEVAPALSEQLSRLAEADTA